MMSARDYILYKNSEFIEIQQQYHQLLQEWSNDWLIDELPMVSIKAIAGECVDQLTTGELLLFSDNENNWCVFEISNEALRLMYARLMGIGVQKAIGDINVNYSASGQLIAESLKHLYRNFSSDGVDTSNVRQSTVSALPITATSSGSGCVYFKITIGDLSFAIMVSHSLVANILSRNVNVKNSDETLSSVRSSIVASRVNCKVSLGAANLKLEELLSLEVGDVIRLDQNIGDPVKILINDNETNCRGVLGMLDGEKVISVVANGK